MAHAEHHGLMALFALECDGHLRDMHARLPALAAADPATAQLATMAVLDSLHTLAGAARVVELPDLEFLCRALEALAGNGAADWTGERLALLEQGLALAPQLLVPGARVRKGLMDLAARCRTAQT
jgi:chemotaxis protein histidine kinase CheA